MCIRDRRLAYYCVPTSIYAVEAFPLTARGKIDKALLLQQAFAAEVARHA